jgi:hypothetical protein
LCRTGQARLRDRSSRQRERLGLNLNKHAAQRSYSPVKIGRLGALQVGEEAADPRREMILEQRAIGVGRSREAPAYEPCHDLAQNRRMIFRFGLPGAALNPELGQIRAQARERPLM